ncbi:unnamed protein product, partial [Protopolystoma xenopodis]
MRLYDLGQIQFLFEFFCFLSPPRFRHQSRPRLADLVVSTRLQLRQFLLAVYLEPMQLRPAFIWHWSVQALKRVDLTAVVGCTTQTGLLIRGDCLSPSPLPS